MKRAGRPLRFLMLVFGAWTGLRTWQLWPDPPASAATRAVVRRIAAGQVARLAMATAVPPTDMVAMLAADRGDVRPIPVPRAATATTTAGPVAKQPPATATAATATHAADPPVHTLGLFGMVRYGTPAPPPADKRRWSVSGWAMLRGSGPGSGVATPQLGGSQAGIRIARTLDAHGRVAIAARVAAALDTRQQEAAIGLEWRPLALPVRIVAERRFGIANQRGGSALGLVGGIDDHSLPGGFRLDGYAQAGLVFRDRGEAYADGALHLTHAVARSQGGTTIALGLGAWGGVQRDARRLDVGPAATLDVPLGTASHLRLALEWRQRVAGDARPASGPALSIGTDY